MKGSRNLISIVDELETSIIGDLVMDEGHVILNNGIPRRGVEHVVPGQGNTTGQPEQPRTSDDRNLSHRAQGLVAAENAERAPVVLPTGEGEVQGHQQPHLITLRRRAVHPLRPTNLRRIELGSDGELVVDHHHRPEERRRLVGRRRLGDLDGGWSIAAQYVVEVEVQVGYLLVSQPEAAAPVVARGKLLGEGVGSEGGGDEGEEECKVEGLPHLTWLVGRVGRGLVEKADSGAAMV